MIKNNLALVLIWLSFCLFSTATTALSYDDIITNKLITVAVYNEFPPFSYKENGKELGIDVEIAKHIAKELGVKLELMWLTAGETAEDDLRNGIWQGHALNRSEGEYYKRNVADLMLRVPYDKEFSMLRDDIGELANGLVHMFGPYHTESWQIIFDNKKIESVSTIAVFQYHDIGVEVDSIPQFYLISAFNGRMRDRAKQFHTLPLAIDALQAHKVDAVMGMRSQISHFQKALQPKANFQLAENAFPNIGKQQWDIGMAVKTDYRQLGYAVGDIVETMIRKGTMKQIFSQYGAIYQVPKYYTDLEK